MLITAQMTPNQLLAMLNVQRTERMGSYSLTKLDVPLNMPANVTHVKQKRHIYQCALACARNKANIYSQIPVKMDVVPLVNANAQI